MSKKIKQYISTGLYADKHGITGSAWQDIGSGYGQYILNFHQGEMPAYGGKRFATLEGLEDAMRKHEPDLRKWRVRMG